MHAIKSALLTGVLAVSALSAPAHALIIQTIDPDNYAIGTNLTNAIPGVTISRLEQPYGGFGVPYNPVRRDVFAGQNPYYLPAEGFLSFGGTTGIDNYRVCYSTGMMGCSQGYSLVEFLFDTPIDFFQLNFTWLSDAPGVLAYDSGGNEIAFCGTPFGQLPATGPCDLLQQYDPSGGTNRSIYSLGLDSRTVSRIVAGGWPGNSVVTQIAYSVPEPGTLALLGLGFAGLGLSRRRLVN